MQTSYADVIVDISHEKLDKTFSYRIPSDLRDRVLPGCVVSMPFGAGGRVIRGYVVGLSTTCSVPADKIKEIREVVTDDETVDSRLVSLAAWMSRTYGSTTIQALKTVIPIRKKIAGKQNKQVFLVNKSEAEAYLQVSLDRHFKAKARVLEALLKEEGERGVSQQDLLKKTGVSLPVLKGLADLGLIRIDVSDTYRKVVRDAQKLPPDQLTEDQEEAVREIREEWQDKDRPVLLNGITGSGKTLVYMQLISDLLKEGRQAIVLIPEIALTRQTVLRFVSRFGDQVSFLHSRLSQGERYDQMKAARQGAVSIMVGPRSALFTPFPNLGLIVIDEEHESTYHSEQMPRYHARETAVKRAELEGAHVVFGSATPSLEVSSRAREGLYREVRLKNRYGRSQLPSTEIIDMREELAHGNRSIFSDRLRDLMENRLNKKEQIMLFLNRRGYAGCVTCRTCGRTIKCPHCDVSLTQHANGKLVCHYCGYQQDSLTECPSCHSRQIGGLTIGTEQVEDLVKRDFPRARVLRMDADTTRGKEGHARILAAFDAGEADILIGTQMIVKGHDFPKVTLVGVLMADLSLNESDFRSSERTFELITQAVGRAGRGERSGTAIIQTYQPDHFGITTAAAQDYDAFYQNEMAFRTILGYPPAGSMTAILGSSTDQQQLKTGMEYLKKYIGLFDPTNALEAIGPAPQSVGKIKDRYREVIYIRNKDRDRLIKAKDLIEQYLAINPGFAGIEIQFDMNL